MVLLLILWTWGLTPLWVNIVASICYGLKVILTSIFFWCSFFAASRAAKDPGIQKILKEEKADE